MKLAAKRLSRRWGRQAGPGHPRVYSLGQRPEFTARDLRKGLAGLGAGTLDIEPGNAWGNSYCESSNGKLRASPRLGVEVKHRGRTAARMQRANLEGNLGTFFQPSLTLAEREVEKVEGWILGLI